MFPSHRVRVLVSTQPIDFRKGHDGLADDFLDLLVVRIFGLEKKDIHITHGSEFTAPVATESHEAKAPSKGLADDFTDDAVNMTTIAKLRADALRLTEIADFDG